MPSLRFHGVVFGLAIMASTLLVGADGTCDPDALKSCTADILSGAQSMKFSYTAEQIDAQCRLVDSFRKCINTTGCATDDPSVQTVVDGIKRVTDYMCVQHKAEFLEHGPCLSSKKLEKSVNFCVENAGREVGKTPCESTNRLMSCVLQSVQGCCGQTVGDLVDGLLKDSLPQTGDCRIRTDLAVDILEECSGCTHLVQFDRATLLVFIILSLLGKNLL